MKTTITETVRPLLPLAAALLAACSPAPPTDADFDLLLLGGTVIDGTGSERRIADVGLKDGEIALVGDASGHTALETIDVTGLVVAPGFIDAHNHTEVTTAKEEHKLNEQFVRQGVTTIVGGPDGSLSPAHIRQLMEAIAEQGAGVNVATYVGHNAIRRGVMGDSRAEPSDQQMSKMKSLVEEGMELGAVGFSTGLMYEPGMWSTTEEVAQLARGAADYGGIYDSHVRDPVHRFVYSHSEAIEVGRLSGAPAKLGHLKSVALENEGKMAEVISEVEEARADGRVVVSDQYPYDGAATANLIPVPGVESSRGILLVPKELLAGRQVSDFDFKSALADPDQREAIRQASENGINGGFAWLKATGYTAMRITHSDDFPELVGRYLWDIAADRGVAPFDAIAELVIAADHPVHLTLGAIKEWEVRELLIQPWNMIASDGSFAEPGGVGGHPRSTGTFPRLLGHYARDEAVLSLEEAVRKITSLPAEFLRLWRRGVIEEGAVADLAIFDPDTIIDRSTWTEPNLYAEGVVHVVVNGELVLRDAEMTGAAPGAFLMGGPAPGAQIQEITR